MTKAFGHYISNFLKYWGYTSKDTDKRKAADRNLSKEFQN